MILVRDFWFRPIARCRSVQELVDRSGLTADEILDAIGGTGYVRGVWLEPELDFIRWLEEIEPHYVPIDPVGPKSIAEMLGMGYVTVRRIVDKTEARLKMARRAAA